MPTYTLDIKQTRFYYASVTVEAATPEEARTFFYRGYHKYEQEPQWDSHVVQEPKVEHISETPHPDVVIPLGV